MCAPGAGVKVGNLPADREGQI